MYKKNNLKYYFLVISIDDIKNLTSKLELKDINKNGYELIFNSLDRNKDGIVSIDEFLESISNRETNPELIERFLDKVNDNLLTTSEIMMIKIKKLKERATYSNDEESLNDLNW